MCGIAGFYAADQRAFGGADTLWSLAWALRHRGPDDQGIWLNEMGNIGLAHTRLAIIDLSSAGHQPMVSASGRFVLAFNGEIYNYRVLSDELLNCGFRPHGHSDSEVLLAGFERWGVDATLRRAAGMFAIAVVDQRERTLTLARDRLGEKPLYLARCGSSYAFASELGALSNLPGAAAGIDGRALYLYLQCNYIPAPFSIYSNVTKVEPGTYLTLASSGGNVAVTATRYWGPPAERAPQSSDPVTLEELEATLRLVTREQMISDRPLGAFLSGGVDSSLVTMLMQEEAAAAVCTFTVGFEDQQFNELPFAREIADRLGTDHHEIMLGPSAGIELVDQLPQVYSEPFADSSQIPTLLVTREARRHVVVALSGDGGDENFAGYDRYFQVMDSWRHLKSMPLWSRSLMSRLLLLGDRDWIDGGVARAVNRLVGRHPARRLSSVFRHAARVLGARSMEARYRDSLSVWSRPEDALNDAPAGAASLVADASSPAETGLRRLMAIDLRSYLPDDILVKVDRASMSVGLECRAPLLDHRVVELAWRLDEPLLSRDGRGKYPLRQLLARRLPAQLFERPKQGFAVPIGMWLRTSLREWAEDLLSERALGQDAPFLNAREVRRRWQQHLAGVWDNSAQLWGILQLVRWCRLQRPRPQISWPS